MSPMRKTGIIAYRKAAKYASSEIIPEPPKRCDGYLYKIKEDDTLYKIAKKFKCNMQKILHANPQLPSRSGTIFVRQLICIPDFDIFPSTLLLPIGPQVLSVQLLDAAGTPLQIGRSGFLPLLIRIPPDCIFFLKAGSLILPNQTSLTACKPQTSSTDLVFGQNNLRAVILSCNLTQAKSA